jgi:hypothetical protein
MREHLIHFKVIRGQETKLLRGLIYLEDGRQPTLDDFARCLRECGHQVQLADPEQCIFRAYDESGREYLIDVLENYQKPSRDRPAEQLAKTFLKQDPLL